MKKIFVVFAVSLLALSFGTFAYAEEEELVEITDTSSAQVKAEIQERHRYQVQARNEIKEEAKLAVKEAAQEMAKFAAMEVRTEAVKEMRRGQ
jgi:hypothetical protein